MANAPDIEHSPGLHLFRGSVWMIALRWGLRLTGLLSTIILARLLSPADFGIVAMAMVIIGALEVLSQSGHKLAIIRHTAPLKEHYDTAWTLSIILGFLIGSLVWIAAPATSVLFHEARVIPVMHCLAFRAVLGGFENIGVIDMRRNLNFGRFFFYNMYAKLASFCVTIVLAFVLRNYWALVFGILTGQLSQILLSFVMHPLRPRFSLSRFGELSSFSMWNLMRALGNYLSGQVDQLAVGAAFGTAPMGRYAVVNDLASSATREINEPMVAVLYPVMARLQHDRRTLTDLYLRVLSWSVIICTATGVGIALVAHDIVEVVLGPKWISAESLVVWLALSAALLGLSSGAYTVFDVVGKPHLGARMQWMRVIFLAGAIGVVSTWAHEATDIAIARWVMTALFMPTLFFAVGREIGVSVREYVKVLYRPLLACFSMAACILPANTIIAPGPTRLFFDVGLGATAFLLTLIGVWRLGGSPRGPEDDIVRHLSQLWSFTLRRAQSTLRG